MSQKDVFLESEADAWFARNRNAISKRDFAVDDSVCQKLFQILETHKDQSNDPLRILEVGCGEGARLAWLAESMNADVYGIEPSAQAVDVALNRGVKAQRGTADSLPFDSATFDVVIFGFCLYLCDREDLFQIASEADRVMKSSGWLIIQDFFAQQAVANEYHHRPGIQSYKMDYRQLFSWHPAYTCLSHDIVHHGNQMPTDDKSEWMATSVLRKRLDDE